MAEATAEYVAAVSDVVSICRDAEEGFRGAAQAVENPGLKSTFEEYSAQRAQFARELQRALQHAGGEAADPSGTVGSVQSAWMKIKGVLTGHDEHAILSTVEGGEDLSVQLYNDAVAKDPPRSIKEILDKQREQVVQAHNRIRDLRDQTE